MVNSTSSFEIKYPNGIVGKFSQGYTELIPFYTTCEMETKRYLCDTIQKDWNVVDVGANVGMLTVLMAHLTQGQVVAIEGSRDNYDLLNKNLADNKLQASLTLLLRCVSNIAETKQEVIHYLWTGRGSVGRHEGEITFDTLDNILMPQFAETGTPIHLIKIDIDGYDFEAVQGCTEIMKLFKPIMLVELVDEALRLHGHSKSDVIYFMKSQNYELTRVLDNCNYIFEFKI